MRTRTCLAGLGRRPVAFTTAVPNSRNVVRRIGPNPKANSQVDAELSKAMQDPNFQKEMQQMQEMLKRPDVQKQMAEMQAMAQNQQLRQKMQALEKDPEFAEVFADIQKGGMQALMKYYNDPAFLAKIGEKIGDVASSGSPASPAASAATPEVAPEPEINNIRDAAKWGDEEAVEDFIAIGKDINEPDSQGRTALHYAVAYDHAVIAKMLVDEGANLEARDSMNNMPLHYACGYGRNGLVRLLLKAGADKGARNNTGKTPVDLAMLDGRNPVGADEELLKDLQP